MVEREANRPTFHADAQVVATTVAVADTPPGAAGDEVQRTTEAALAASQALTDLRLAATEPEMHAAAARFLASARAALPVERILIFVKAALFGRGDRHHPNALDRSRRVVSRVIEAYYATSYEEPAPASLERAVDVRPVGVGKVGVHGM